MKNNLPSCVVLTRVKGTLEPTAGVEGTQVLSTLKSCPTGQLRGVGLGVGVGVGVGVGAGVKGFFSKLNVEKNAPHVLVAASERFPVRVVFERFATTGSVSQQSLLCMFDVTKPVKFVPLAVPVNDPVTPSSVIKVPDTWFPFWVNIKATA